MTSGSPVPSGSYSSSLASPKPSGASSSCVADRAVAPQPSLEHPEEHRHIAVDVIVDPDLGLAGMEAMQPARVLHERALPGDRQREEQRVEARIVEALADVATGGQDQALLVGRDRGKLVSGSVSSPSRHPPVKDDEVAREALQPVREELQMVLPLREEDGGPALLEGGDHVIEDQVVACLVGGERGVELLDALSFRRSGLAEGGSPDDETVLEGPPSGLAPGVDGEAHRSELHLGDGVLAVPPLWGRCQAHHVASLHLRQHPLERHRRDVVALVHDDLAIARRPDPPPGRRARGSGASPRRAGRSAIASRRRSGRSPWARYRGRGKAARATGRAAAAGAPEPACFVLAGRPDASRPPSCPRREGPRERPSRGRAAPGRPSPERASTHRES